MKLLKCTKHGYTLKAVCSKCGAETKSAHYKHTKISDAKVNSGR